jgi:hypothetical protein
MSDDGGDNVFPVRVAASDARGRDYAATRALVPDELVLRVAPLAAVPTDECALRVCSGCFCDTMAGGARAPPPMPCPGCEQVVLCRACAAPGSHAAALHRDECAALRLLFNSPHTRRLDEDDAGTALAEGGRAGVRLLLRLMYARMRLRRGIELPPSPAELSELDVIQDGFEDVWSLEEHWDDFSEEVAERLEDMAKQAKFVCGADARGSLEESVSLLAHCYSNAFKLPQQRGAGWPTVTVGTQASTVAGRRRRRGSCEPDRSHKSHNTAQSVGVGVFVSASFLNHSCDPNCRWAIDSNGFLVVTTRRSVQRDELLTISCACCAEASVTAAHSTLSQPQPDAWVSGWQISTRV